MGFYLRRQKIAKARFFEKLLCVMRKISVILIILIVLSGMTYWFYKLICFTEYFAVKRTEVIGSLMHLTASEIVEASGVSEGQNLFSMSVSEIQDRIKTNPWVDRVAVRRKLPHDVWIYLVEYVPEMLIALDNLYYVDGKGVVFKALAAEDEKNYPVITGIQAVKIGEDEKQIERMLEILNFKRAYESTAAFKHYGLSEINYNELKGYAIITEHGPMRIDVGENDLEEKFERLDTVLDSIQRQYGAAKWIDLKYGNKIVVKY